MHWYRISLLAAGCIAAPVAAHDFWLQPRLFLTTQNAQVPLNFLVGHGVARQRSTIPQDRVKVFRTIGPEGTADRRDRVTLGGAADAVLSFAKPGTYVVAFGTSNVPSELPALRFNDYATAEGLTLVMQQRKTSGALDKPGRELYSRRGKTLIQVGPPGSTPQPQVTVPANLGLEIVPAINPYQPGNAKNLTVQILYQGRPLQGALVKLNNLQSDEKPVELHPSDSAGRATFRLPRSGQWQLNVVWSQPLPANGSADFLTTFSSLSFGFGAGSEG